MNGDSTEDRELAWNNLEIARVLCERNQKVFPEKKVISMPQC